MKKIGMISTWKRLISSWGESGVCVGSVQEVRGCREREGSVSLLAIYFRSIILVLKSDTRDNLNDYNHIATEFVITRLLESIRTPEQTAGLQQNRFLATTDKKRLGSSKQLISSTDD
jgi:hypothetical protein